MSDLFRKTMDKRVGPGGVKCRCCNKFKGAERKVLRRLVRRALKRRVKTTMKFFIFLFLLLTSNSFALGNLFNPEELEKYPYLKQWTVRTGWKLKACSPAAWAYLSDYVEPNIENTITCLHNNPIDKEVKVILTEGRDNNCFRLALIYSFYIILGTGFDSGSTEAWNLSEPLLKGIYSGDQVLPEQDLLPLVEDSLKKGMPCIVSAYGKVGHTWLVVGFDKERKFIVFPNKTYDFYNGDFGSFSGLESHMNFVNLRKYDGSHVTPMEELYGSDNNGFCFIDALINL